MRITRRDAIKGAGVTAGLAASSGTAFAIGEYEDDERDAVERRDVRSVENPTTAVRVVHVSPDAPAVDVLVDDERIVADLAFDEVSPYIEVEHARHDVALTTAGDPDDVLWERDAFFGDAYYTVFAHGSVEGGSFRGFIERDAGSALLKFVHSAPDAPRVDVFADGVQIARDVRFNRSSSYVAIPGDSYAIDVRRAGTDESLGTFDATLEGGVAYTGVALEDPDLTLRLLEDGPTADE